MAKLTTTSSVRTLMRQADVTDITEAIDAALEAASFSLEQKIRSSFARETRYDLFVVRHRKLRDTLYEYHWRLKNGFVDSGETFTVKVADAVADFATAGLYTDITDSCTIDYEKGTVSLLSAEVDSISVFSSDSRLTGNFVRVDYTSGFTATTGLYAEVPDWLQNAAKYDAIVQLNALSPALWQKSDDAPFSLNQLKGVYNSMWTGRVRYYPNFENPIAKT